MDKKVISLSSLTGPLKKMFGNSAAGKWRLQSLIALLLAIAIAVYVFPPAWNRAVDFVSAKTDKKISLPHLKDTGFHFGLDLLGGTHLVYEADTSKIAYKDQASAVDGVRDVIERRVNSLGISEPVVQTNYSGDSWRVIVELAGVKNVSDAIKQIGETPILQFREQAAAPQKPLTNEEQADMIAFNKKAESAGADILLQILKGGNFEDLAYKYSEDPGSRDQKGDLGWFRDGQMVLEFETAVKTLEDNQISQKLVKSQFGFHIIKRTGMRVIDENGAKVTEYRASHILIKTKSAADYATADDYWTDTELSGKQLERASVQFDPQTGEPEISLQFNGEGTKLFKEITTRNVGKPVGIFLDGQPISLPRVNEPIIDGSARITGSFDIAEAKLLAQRLNAGALPVPIKLVSQQTVDASLGAVSIQKSLMAALIGFALIALFMVVYYRLAGLMAILALTVYASVSLAIFKFVPVTLTLAGIAGFILSFGIAVDANVLIFARLKEELRDGKTMDYAITEAFRRAWPSIRDGNATTLITCAILFWFSTSLLRGFALTLSFGILASMFTAIVVTRIFMRALTSFISNRKWIVG
jgi:protein-export membrane protein SecD